MIRVILERLEKRFGSIAAVDGVSSSCVRAK